MNIRRTVNAFGIVKYFNENNELHREDGPAVILMDNSVLFYLDGVHYSEKLFENEIIKRKLKRLTDL